MKQKKLKLLRVYREALELYLKTEPKFDLEAVKKLGELALSQGLETLDLAEIHQAALIFIVLHSESTGNYEDMIRLSGKFFAEAVTPIEANHLAAKKMNKKLTSTVNKLKKKTTELADANLALSEEIERREGVESSLMVSEASTSKLLKEALHLQKDLRLLSRRLLVAQEEERKRISRELHDIVAQTLTGINLRLAALTIQTTANSEDIHQKIADTQKLVEQSVEEVHRFAQDLRPSVLDDLGLVPALKSFLEKIVERSGIQAQLKVFANIEELNEIFREVLFRVAQEALSNVEQHSKASNVIVTIKKLKKLVQMEIRDNGKGFDSDDKDRTLSSERLGFLGMRERVEMINGHFNVESKLGQETIVRVDIPWSSDTDLVATTEKPTTIPLK